MKLSARGLFLGMACLGFALLTGCGGGGGDPHVIKIVSSLPRTGSAKNQTDTVVNGIKLALSEVGYQVGDFKIEYADWDDATAAAGQWTPEQETANASRAVRDQDVMVYIGTYNSGAAKISMPILNRAQLLMISPANTAVELTKPGMGSPNEPGIYRPTGKINYFRVVPTDDLQASRSADWAKDLGVQRVFVLDDKELYGQGIAKLFVERCRQIGITVLGHESIDSKAQEFTALMTQIKSTSPDLVYFGGTTQSKGGQIAKEIVQVGLNCKIMVPDACFEEAFIEAAGAQNVNDRCYVTFGGMLPSELKGPGKEFVEKYRATYNGEPEGYAVYGYEATKVALEAIRKANKKDREAITEACRTLTDFSGGALGEWSFDENGDTSLTTMSGNIIRNGKFEFVKLLGADEPAQPVADDSQSADSRTIEPRVSEVDSGPPETEAVEVAEEIVLFVNDEAPKAREPEIIKIVSSLPRSGSAKAATDTVVNGIKLALSEAGNKVGEYAIEYADWDDATGAAGQWTPEQETANASRAVRDPDVMVYIGTYNSGAAKVSMPILNRAELLMISPSNSAPELTKPGMGNEGEPACYRPSGKINYFRVVPADDVQGPTAANWAKEMGVKRVFVLDDREGYGRGIAKLFAERCRQIGVTVLGQESINSKAQEFTALMTQVKSTSPDLVYFGGTTQSKAGQIAKEIVKVGLDCKIMVPDACFEEAFIAAAGASNLNDRCYMTFGGLPPGELTGAGKKFVDRYRAIYEDEPEVYAVYGYEAAKVALEAIRKAGKKDRAAITEACRSLKDFKDGALGKWSFDEHGDISLASVSGYIVRDGEFEFIKALGQK